VSSPFSLMTSVAKELRGSLRAAKQGERRAAEHDQAVQAPRDGNDPVEYVQKALNLTPWARQAEIMRAIAVHKRVAVRSGRKIGKSTLAAAVGLWWVGTKKRGRVIMTAPTARQVEIILWREARRIYREAGGEKVLGGEIHESPASGLVYLDGREMMGFSTNEPERMAGISGADVLFIVDEGSGVEEEIFAAIEGNRAGGASLLVLGNPTKTSGTFYDAFTTKRQFWKLFHVSSMETPNYIEGRDVIPGLATREWIEEMRQEWGEESPFWQVHVLGEFPSQAENAVIGLALVEAALARYDDTHEDGRLEIGVDVARFGDDESVIWPRRGHKAMAPTILRGADTLRLCGEVKRIARDLRIAGDGMDVPAERPLVKVDGAGVGGGAVDVLKDDRELEVVEVNAGEASTGDTYARLRDQLWFALRDWLKAGGAIPRDEKLAAELVAPIYGFDLRGRIKVESKDDLRERLGRSPDRADALALAVFNRPTMGTSATFDAPTSDEYWERAEEEKRNTNLEGFR